MCLLPLTVSLKIQSKFPEIPLDMSVCNGSDNEDLGDGSDNQDLGVKQEPLDSDKVKLEEVPPELPLKSEDAHSGPQHTFIDAQLQKVTVTDSGKL